MTSAAAEAPAPPPGKRYPYFNRELSWLAFNRRVLEQAQDPRYPILERVRFLSFVSSNFDEFFEIRVAGLMQQQDSGVVEAGIDGLGPAEQLRRIHNVATTMVADQYRCWNEQISPALKADGIVFKNNEELNAAELRWLRKFFDDQIYPVLTPLAIDPAHPFPIIGNKSLNILVSLDDPSTTIEEKLMAIIPVPRILSRLIEVRGGSSSETRYIFLSDILKIMAEQLFPGYRVRTVHAFRITRNSDLYIDEEEIENLLLTIEEELYKLRKGDAVRLEIEDGVEQELLDELLEKIDLARDNVFRVNGPINLMRLMALYERVDRPDLKFKPYIPFVPAPLMHPDAIFENIQKRDILLHHPYDSFAPVIDFVKRAATDPEVLAIKLTLYRTSSDSPIVRALMEAARNGKQVTALIELKARFDEAANIRWARELEEAGVHVVYGIVGLKTHCKCALVVRRESHGLRRYAHLGTGNYHPNTAKLYTDLSFFTCNPETTGEVAEVFNTLTGFARDPEYEKLLVAPYTLHARMQELIEREAQNAREGKPARIVVKTNSLIDRETIDNLYLASQADVPIELIVRGICGLVPGIRGVSDNIRVRSILGRYLEHSRIYYFLNHGGDPIVYIGSADWMPRNFYRRIEVVFPIEDPAVRQRIIDQILDAHLRDNQNARFLTSTGAYVAPALQEGDDPFSGQEFFMREAEKKRAQIDLTAERQRD